MCPWPSDHSAPARRPTSPGRRTSALSERPPSRRAGPEGLAGAHQQPAVERPGDGGQHHVQIAGTRRSANSSPTLPRLSTSTTPVTDSRATACRRVTGTPKNSAPTTSIHTGMPGPPASRSAPLMSAAPGTAARCNCQCRTGPAPHSGASVATGRLPGAAPARPATATAAQRPAASGGNSG